jgi:hypothetical protein
MMSNCHNATHFAPMWEQRYQRGAHSRVQLSKAMQSGDKRSSESRRDLVGRHQGEWLAQGHTDEMATATYRLRLDAATVSAQVRVVDSTLLELTLTRKL